MPGCYAFSVSLCIDPNCSALVKKESLYLLENPSFRDEVSEFPSPILRVNTSDSSLVQQVFLVAQGSNSNITASVAGVVAVCGEVMSVRPQYENITINLAHAVNNSFIESLDRIFTKESQSRLVSPDDCSVLQYKLCDD
jgi:hypothetical protein